MPHFHLNVFNSVDAPDAEGNDYDDLEAAKAEAIAGAREMIAFAVKDGRPVFRSHRIEVTDDAGATLHIVRFGDMVDLRD